MSESFDPNKLAAAFLQANLDRILAVGADGARGLRSSWRAHFPGTYATYLERVLDQYSKARPFFFRSEPLPLRDIFEPLDVSTERRHLKKATVLDVSTASPHWVLKGSGGCGKTMMMRHFLIGCIESRAKTPVFIELRQFNRQPGDLRTALLTTLTSNHLDADDGYVERALEAGHFCLLLDGFDELNLDLRDSMACEIRDLAIKYPANWIAVSSRPDLRMDELQGFTQFSVDPLDLDSAASLVEKLPCDPAVKAGFVNDLRSQLFAKHKSFLSNPLLLTIMLLTYTDVAHIPTKVSLFYERAYEALFERHDASKGVFQRQHQSGLDIQDFAKVFAAFCLVSYDEGAFQFTRTAALEYLDKAKMISQCAYTSSEVLDDAIQAVCLLFVDGLDIVFPHRSFQEYFVARFIHMQSTPGLQGRLVSRVARNVSRDSVLPLLFEMDATAVERFYLLPAIKKLEKTIGSTVPVSMDGFLAYLKLVFGEFRLADRKDGPVATTRGGPGLQCLEALVFVHDQYGDLGAGAKAPDPSWPSELADSLAAETGGQAAISTSGLTADSPFVKCLAKGPGLFGTDFLALTLGLAREIEHRQARVEASLAEMFGGGRRISKRGQAR